MSENSELDELLLGALDVALSKYLVKNFGVLMVDPSPEGIERFMAGLEAAVGVYVQLRPMLVRLDGETETS